MEKGGDTLIWSKCNISHYVKVVFAFLFFCTWKIPFRKAQNSPRFQKQSIYVWSVGCSIILKLVFEFMPARTACPAITGSTPKNFRHISQYMTDCTTVLCWGMLDLQKWSQNFCSGTRSAIFGHIKMGTFGTFMYQKMALRVPGQKNGDHFWMATSPQNGN